jgi:hypothetical protein
MSSVPREDRNGGRGGIEGEGEDDEDIMKSFGRRVSRTTFNMLRRSLLTALLTASCNTYAVVIVGVRGVGLTSVNTIK